MIKNHRKTPGKFLKSEKKLLFTAFIILVFRIGSFIPVPFLDIAGEIEVGRGNTILTYLSLMTGFRIQLRHDLRHVDHTVY